MALSKDEQAEVDALNAASHPASTTPATPRPRPGPAPFLTPVKAGIKASALPLDPVVKGAMRAIGTPVGKVFDLVNRPDEATIALGARGFGPALQTLLHSESPEQYQKDTEADSARMMALSPAQYAALPGWRRKADDFATQFDYDPTDLIGGLGLGERATEALGEHGVPLLSRAVDAASRSPHLPVRIAGKALGDAYDFTHFKGAAQRALALGGKEGLNQFRGLKAINAGMHVASEDLENTLAGHFHQAIDGLSRTERAELYDAVHTGDVGGLSPKVRARVPAFKQVTDELAHLQGDAALRETLAANGFTFPKALRRFEGAEPRAMQTLDAYRPDYVPVRHVPKAIDPESILGLNEPMTKGLADQVEEPEQTLEDAQHAFRPEAQHTTLDAKDANLLRRRDGEAQLLPPEMQTKVIEARLRRGARAISAHDAEQRINALFGVKRFARVPAAAKAFFRESYREPGAEAFWRGLIDVPKVGLFSLPFRHTANIGTLATLADPLALPGTLGNYAYLLAAGSGSRRVSQFLDRMGVAGAAEWVSPEAAAARRAKFLDLPSRMGVAGAAAHDSQRSVGWIGEIPLVGDIYRASNHLLWSFDDAAKATRFNRLLKTYRAYGLDEDAAAYKAAETTGAELINYGERSPLTEALSYILPFATYRTKFPVAVARGVLAHPDRIAQMGRLSPELVGDAQKAAPTAKGEPQVGRSYLPVAEALRGVENPAEFARASLGYPTSMVASGIGDLIEHGAGIQSPAVANYFTYGRDPWKSPGASAKYLANETLGSFPGGEAALGALGAGEWKGQGSFSGALRAQTGFGLVRGPSPTQLELPAEYAALQQAEQAALKAGNTALAQKIRYMIEDKAATYRAWEP